MRSERRYSFFGLREPSFLVSESVVSAMSCSATRSGPLGPLAIRGTALVFAGLAHHLSEDVGRVRAAQRELGEKFAVEFTILTRDMIEASRLGNPFVERNLWI